MVSGIANGPEGKPAVRKAPDVVVSFISKDRSASNRTTVVEWDYCKGLNTVVPCSLCSYSIVCLNYTSA